jgi:hypothetical protein
MPTVTGLDIRTRIQQTINYFKSLVQQNDEIASSARVPLLPAPRQNADAHTWERNAHFCEKHSTPNFRSLVTTPTLKFGEYYCSQCEQEQNEASLLKLDTSTIHALFPENGQLARRVHMGEWRHNMQEDAAKGFIACFSTQKKLSDTPEIAELATIKPQRRTPTSPLPARDIQHDNTPPPISQIPTAALPDPRVDLFSDLQTIHASMESEDIGPDTDTQKVPCIHAEMTLRRIIHSPTHEQATGEQERLPATQDAFLL